MKNYKRLGLIILIVLISGIGVFVLISRNMFVPYSGQKLDDCAVNILLLREHQKIEKPVQLIKLSTSKPTIESENVGEAAVGTYGYNKLFSLAETGRFLFLTQNESDCSYFIFKQKVDDKIEISKPVSINNRLTDVFVSSVDPSGELFF